MMARKRLWKSFLQRLLLSRSIELGRARQEAPEFRIIVTLFPLILLAQGVR